ncbi:Phage protein [Dyella sp. 333MFSha]|nr:Phage protein [Dyella sp. 333MFSha]
MTCFLSQKRCAAFLGVPMRTVQNWDNGQRRVPWSVVRLLRLLRLGDLGALEDGWDDFKLVRGKLVTPDGRVFQQSDMRHWWITVEHAHLCLKRYEDEARSVGRRPALTLQPEVVEARVLVEALPSPVEAAAQLNQLLGLSLQTSGIRALASPAGDLARKDRPCSAACHRPDFSRAASCPRSGDTTRDSRGATSRRALPVAHRDD